MSCLLELQGRMTQWIIFYLQCMNDLILVECLTELYMIDHHIWYVSQIIHNESWDNLMEKQLNSLKG